MESVKYWLDGPVGLAASLFGVGTNVVALVVLARTRVQRNFHMLMMFLSLWDLAYLLLSMACFSLPVMSTTYRDKVFIYAVPYIIPVAQICLSGSCFSTVALTIERYIAMCMPFFRLRHNIRVRMYIVPILVFAPIYNSPRFFEFMTVTQVASDCSNVTSADVAGNGSIDVVDDLMVASNGTIAVVSDIIAASRMVNETDDAAMALASSYDPFELLPVNESNGSLNDNCAHKFTTNLIVTDFRKNPTYISVYVNLLNWLVNLIIPTSLLVVLNCLIYRALRRNETVTSSLSAVEAREAEEHNNHLRRNIRSQESLRKRDLRLTRIAIVIVCVFIVCHLPRFVPNVVELFTDNLPEYFAVIVSFNNLLQILNCSVNYIIYYLHCYKKKEPREEVEMDVRGFVRKQASRTVTSESKMIE